MISENLQQIIDSKQEMADAISSKGVEVEGGLVTYADAIRRIEVSEGGEGELVIVDVYDKFYILTDSLICDVTWIDTSNMTSMKDMFNGNSGIESIKVGPRWDTANVTNMERMFAFCENLKESPELYPNKVTQCGWLFQECFSLERIQLIDMRECTFCSFMFYDLYSDPTSTNKFRDKYFLNLQHIEGFAGLSCNTGEWFLNRCPNLTKQSLLNVIESVADVNDIGYRVIYLGADNINKLSQYELSLLTNKGWEVR